MKKVRIIGYGMILCWIYIVVSCSSPNQAVQNEQTQAVKELIESKHYTIQVNRMLPMKGPSKSLTSSYSISIKGDTLQSYLPYFGQAYNVPYGGGNGLNFETKITVYSVSIDSKGTANISIQATTSEDRYRYAIKVFSNGSSTIQVTSNNRQAISYYGDLELKSD